MKRDPVFAEFTDLLFRRAFSISDLNECSHFLSVFFVGNADHLDILNRWVGIEEFFDLPGIDVFSAPDNHVFESSLDGTVPILVHAGQISGMQPSVRVNGLFCLVRHFVIPFHDVISPAAQFTGFSRRQAITRDSVHNLDLHVGEGSAHGFGPNLHGIVTPRLGDTGGAFCLAIDNGQFLGSHFIHDPFHDFHRAGGTGHDPGPQAGGVIRFTVHGFELGDEHGRHPMQGRTFQGIHRLQNHFRFERGHRCHGGAGYRAAHGADYAPEAVKKRHWNAQGIVRGKCHDLGHAPGVADQVAMGEHHAFGISSGAGCVLYHGDIIGVNACGPFIQFGIGNTVAHFHQPVPGEGTVHRSIPQGDDIF